MTIAIRGLLGTVFLGLLTTATASWAQDAGAANADCGGDAFSSAQVIERRPPRRGPIIATPDTLCADVTPQQPAPRVDIYANPVILPENGGRRGSAPYDGWPRRGGPPRF